MGRSLRNDACHHAYLSAAAHQMQICGDIENLLNRKKLLKQFAAAIAESTGRAKATDSQLRHIQADFKAGSDCARKGIAAD